ncbi:hypothetical protein KCP69_24850 [Salmonella enterica subsp. enterica]|nr:hypothetical protein KCP69_24850 [Salmonella enterica subsp. enterica]
MPELIRDRGRCHHRQAVPRAQYDHGEIRAGRYHLDSGSIPLEVKENSQPGRTVRAYRGVGIAKFAISQHHRTDAK